jgi:hypothetical protein
MLDGKRLGPGTFVDNQATYRMEGLWVNDFAFAGKGTKEFTDGNVLQGNFIKG